MLRSFAALALVVALVGITRAQNYDPPAPFPPDAATVKLMGEKAAELKVAFEKMPRTLPLDVRADVEIYLKAVEWIVRHNEFYTKDSGKQVIVVLDAGIARAKAAATGKTPWRDARNKPITRGYYSKIDGSVQPFGVTLPEGFGKDDKKWRLDVVLHGRDSTLTECKYIAGWENSKPAAKGNDFVVLQSFGRGNNAYRWAGESDVFEGMAQLRATDGNYLDSQKVVLRGFSMGGAGTWHIGLHHPFEFNVIGPGAGFTNTHGYIKNLPEKLPDYIEKCLHIYDAVDYAENAFNVPVVAYSGSIDPQKKAADNIEEKLKGFPLPLRFTHIVAPGLEHKMPPEWAAKAEVEYGKFANVERTIPSHVRFVTHTTEYAYFGYGYVESLENQYEKSVVEVKHDNAVLAVKTTNIRALTLRVAIPKNSKSVEIDGQIFKDFDNSQLDPLVYFEKQSGKWLMRKWSDRFTTVKKYYNRQGPIDDAFSTQFTIVPPSSQAWFPDVNNSAKGAMQKFDRDWDRYFRGVTRSLPADQISKSMPNWSSPSINLILFGDPGSNAEIAKLAPKLPIAWTKDKLEVNGVSYDPKTHMPVMIYLDPRAPTRYVVLNSGHTFKEADLKGTNANLYPRLGDWAVLKLAPTAKDPTATEVVAAGLFDENWQFPKK